MTDFDKAGCVLIKGFLDPQAIQTVSKYMEYALNQGFMDRVKKDVATSYARYADPLTEVILENSLSHVEEITGKKLFPTYSFSRVYVEGDVLYPHIDRESCEISVTVHVATVGKPWHIWMKPRGVEPMSFTLEPGDAVVYKGREVAHWREKAVDTDLSAQFMLHYVDQNGPYAGFKLDKRASLGVQAGGI
jgi:alkylated DNA repair dioxygenase AlkB